MGVTRPLQLLQHAGLVSLLHHTHTGGGRLHPLLPVKRRRRWRGMQRAAGKGADCKNHNQSRAMLQGATMCVPMHDSTHSPQVATPAALKQPHTAASITARLRHHLLPRQRGSITFQSPSSPSFSSRLHAAPCWRCSPPAAQSAARSPAPPLLCWFAPTPAPPTAASPTCHPEHPPLCAASCSPAGTQAW
jgi:hypothetical protein